MNEPARGNSQPIRIAINVMRTRVTVVGFNIAVITFQMNNLHNIRIGSIELPSLQASVHIPSDTALFMGLALSVLALVAYVASSAYDRVGVCDHWLLLAGDLLMYLCLAQTIAAFFGPYTHELALMASDFPDHAVAAATVRWAVVIGGGLAWACASYLGPVVAILRSPFGTRATAALSLAYVLTVLALASVSLQATRLQAARADGPVQTRHSSMLLELVQPLRW